METVSFLDICQIQHAIHQFSSEFHGESKKEKYIKSRYIFSILFYSKISRKIDHYKGSQ